jgi:hypothetical protein
MRRLRAPLAASLVLLGVSISEPAAADGAAERCVAQSDEGQFLRDHGKLERARSVLVACAREACPSVVRKACAEWLDDVTSRLPSVFVVVADARGASVAADVQLDGAPSALAIGAASPLDPGFHVFQARAPGKPVAEVKIQLREREKNVPVRLVIEDPPPAAAPGERRVPAMTWILGGVALASAGVSFGFWRDAVGTGDGLERTCAPGCTDGEVAPVERSLLVSQVAGGVAVGAAALALGWLLFAPRSPSPAATRR